MCKEKKEEEMEMMAMEKVMSLLLLTREDLRREARLKSKGETLGHAMSNVRPKIPS